MRHTRRARQRDVIRRTLERSALRLSILEAQGATDEANALEAEISALEARAATGWLPPDPEGVDSHDMAAALYDHLAQHADGRGIPSRRFRFQAANLRATARGLRDCRPSPRLQPARRRGAGRPRAQASRSCSRSGSSGSDSDSDEPGPAGPPLTALHQTGARYTFALLPAEART